MFGNIVAVVEPDPANPPPPPAKPSPTAPNTLLTTYSYDIVNHLTGVSMTRAGVTQNRVFTYNSKMQLYQTSNPESGSPTANGVYTYKYNADGTLYTRQDPKGQMTTYIYDAYKRVTSVGHANDPTQTVTYTYDQGTSGAGRLTGVFQGTTTGGCLAYSESYGYDAPGHVTSKGINISFNGCSTVGMQATWTYDNEGKIKSITYPIPVSGAGPVVNYTYDNMSRLIGVTNTDESGAGSNCATPAAAGSVSWAQSASYTPAGQLGTVTRLSSGGSSCVFANQLWQFNNLNQTIEIDINGAYFVRYHYNPASDNGQTASMDDARAGYTITYQYDALKRLIQATGGSQWSQSYGYDGFGNLTSKTTPSGSGEPSFPGVNSAKNWLNGVTYDANGNTVAGIANMTINYDVENRMASNWLNSQSIATYVYDESNYRIQKTNAGNTTVYFYAPDGKLLANFNAVAGSGAQSPLYRIYFGNLLLGTTKGSPSSDAGIYADRLGTVAAGYPYGTDYNSSGLQGDDAQDFATYVKDNPTGFEYANQRYYIAGYGRFLTPDPSGESWDPSNPSSWNNYSYVLGDPSNLNDPSGLVDCGDLKLTSDRTLSQAALANTDQGHFIDLLWHEAGTFLQAGGNITAWELEFEGIAQAIWDRYEIVSDTACVVGANGRSYCGRTAGSLGYGAIGRGSSLNDVLIAAAAGTSVLNSQGQLTDMGGLQSDLNQDQGDVTKQSPGTVQLANGDWVSPECASVVFATQYADAVAAGYNFNPPGEFFTSWNSSAPVNNPNYKGDVEYFLGSAGPTNFYGFFIFGPRPQAPVPSRGGHR